MKLQNLIVIFIIIILPVILLLSIYISSGLRTLEYQAIYDNGLLDATHSAIHAFQQNTSNNNFSGNPEKKREILRASVKMFEKSLCNTCNITAYNTNEIEEYIPAIVFGMYDGFYMYAPSNVYNKKTGKFEYKHNLKNYVYYSETLEDGTVIRYSLDNYVVVSGHFSSGYEKRSGYLITGANKEGTLYNGISISKEIIDEKENTDAIDYYKKAYAFTDWFNKEIGDKIKDENNKKYLYIDSNNNPEDKNSSFSEHKRTVIKNKIEGVLNSSITAYSNKSSEKVYKMPKLSQQDWEKVYSNISMITFFQGKSIGLTKYNGYCVLNSTNNTEYVNSELMYFTDGKGEYHDIRCEKCLVEGLTLTGYKIGDFQKKRVEKINELTGEVELDENNNVIYEYKYKHEETACYECVNGQINTSKSVYDFIRNANTEEKIKKAYYTSLARERYNTIKLD